MNDRAPLDLYPTDLRLCWEICRWLRKLHPGFEEIWEPSAGPGHFVAAARSHWPSASVLAVDIDRDHKRACMTAGADYFLAGDWRVVAADAEKLKRGKRLVLGNPPYSFAQEHVEAALSILNEHDVACFLLRMGFLESHGRAETLWSKPGLRWLVPLVPRPSFTASGHNDMTSYALFVWQPGWTRRAELAEPLVWRERVQAASDEEAA